MDIRAFLQDGRVIPAHPLALTSERKLSEKYMRALSRYYVESGIGGIAVGVHSTQFEIREPEIGLYQPILELVAETMNESLAQAPRDFLKIAGLCGKTEQAVQEAELASSLGYQAGLLSLVAVQGESEDEMIAHCAEVAKVIPIIGFYLQPAVGGRVLPYSFWRKFMEIPQVICVKIAPFNRYQTIDVVRAFIDSGRKDICLYTGNDDNIIVDLLTQFSFGEGKSGRIIGGLLGQWGVWSKAAVELMEEIKEAREQSILSTEWLTRNAALTDINAAVFDAANNFAGVLPGIHEVLKRQGLMENTFCLDASLKLSDGQSEELDRIMQTYPEFMDDDFVRENIDRWLS
ncbi:MAG: dihydrodipicolinate synthase family protein [Opitutaceae bacterium]|nr:dihydrodipicolinate synthase family protein [Opitutaceae bacterium]